MAFTEKLHPFIYDLSTIYLPNKVLLSMLTALRNFVRQYPLVRNFVAYQLAPSGLFDKFLINRPLDDLWRKRVAEAIECPDNQHIARVDFAGQVRGGKQTMHNGLKIYLGSYYGPEIAQLLLKNKGVHEPQEERVFQEVLPSLKPGATMIELGCFWSFYSMWFQSVIPNSKNFMVEPDDFNLGCGKRNFKLNKMDGDFTLAFVGKKSETGDSVPTICVDDYVETKNIDYVDLLHCDIQGFEYDMLHGAEKTIDGQRVGFIFISTHSNEVHQQCLEFLESKQFFVIANYDLDDSYSQDGLIAAHAPHVNWNKVIPIALKTHHPTGDILPIGKN